MKKPIYIAIIVLMLVAIGFTALMLVLDYDENGESNMPFEVSKIVIISKVDAQDNEDKQNKWNKTVELNNDMFIYITKNEGYKKTETIKSIKIENFKVIQSPAKGEISVFKPDQSKEMICENKEENKATEITFLGTQATDYKKLQISNQGGMIAFRFVNQKLGTYISNENEIEYKDLLKKINITDEEIKAKVSFDMNIILGNGRQFKASDIELDLPADITVENGESHLEKTDLDLAFKRIEN